MPKIAIILFPGINCELETIRTIDRVGMKPDLIRWNDPEVKLEEYDGYIVPGGFSYENRGIKRPHFPKNERGSI